MIWCFAFKVIDVSYLVEMINICHLAEMFALYNLDFVYL